MIEYWSDSLALLEVLALRARDPKQNYMVVAAHIAVENVAYEVDGEYVRQFCEQLGVEFIHRTIATAVKEDSGKPVCFVCSWNRRKTLFGIAKEYGCNKLALGHHRCLTVRLPVCHRSWLCSIVRLP